MARPEEIYATKMSSALPLGAWQRIPEGIPGTFEQRATTGQLKNESLTTATQLGVTRDCPGQR